MGPEQHRRTVSVTVLDPAGATIPSANLELQEVETNDVRRATTQTNGSYTFPNLAFGTYRLTVTAAGFQTQVFQTVQVQTGRATDITATLKVGGTSDRVEVVANATLLWKPIPARSPTR